jgi:hypothetical protein
LCNRWGVAGGAGRCLFPREADETAQPGPIDGVVPIDDMVGEFDEGGSRSMLSCYDESAAGGVVDVYEPPPC